MADEARDLDNLKAVRLRSGASLLDCKKALVISAGHVEDALSILTRVGSGMTRPDFERAYDKALASTQERILCAAIYVDDGRDYGRRSYAYPETGLVFSGWRHSDCFVALKAWWDLLPGAEQARLDDVDRCQGFLTSKGRYVDRHEAWQLAEAAGQILARARHPGTLFSEDLY